MPQIPTQICKLVNGRATLLLGDCKRLTLKADALVADPPYGIRYKSGPNSPNSISSTGKRFQRTIIGDDQTFEPRYWTDKFDKVGFTGAAHFYQKLPSGSLHCWDKRGNYKPLDQADADIIWVSKIRAARVFHLAWRGICRHSENREKILHPTQKPIVLMEWIISLLDLQPGATILDPYMGVATTGIAALNLGFNFIGVEIDPEYYALGAQRLKDYRCPRLNRP